MKKRILILLFLLVNGIVFSQQPPGGIAKLVLQARAQGSIFVPVNDLLVANPTYNSSTIRQQVVNPKYFDFDNTVALDLIQNRKQYISMTLRGATAAGDLVLDLVAVPEADYDFTIKTSSGLEYSGRDVNLVHYWGVVRGNESESVVYLSISDDDVSMDISIKDQGNYEIYRDKAENIHVFYNQSDIENFAESILCGGFEHIPIETTEPTRGKASTIDKCIYIFMEVEYEVYLETDSNLEELQENVLKTFHKVAGLYKNIDVTIKLRVLQLWDTSDEPYTFNTHSPNSLNSNAIHLHDFDEKRQDYIDYNVAHNTFPTDVNIIIFLTAYEAGGIDGIGGQFECLGIDGYPKPIMQKFKGYCGSGNCFLGQKKTMAHEIGHTLGSDHIFDCTWNDNCTKLRVMPIEALGLGYLDCDLSDTNCIVGISEHQSENYFGTIMGYGGELPNFNPFGDQPKERIRNFVNSQTCLSSCDVSCDDLPDVINVGALQDVHSGDDDYRHSEIATYVYNEIDDGGQASYYSATQVFLKPDFKANYGSDFHAAIKPCVYYEVVTTRSVSSSEEIESSINTEDLTLKAYPNPTTGKLVVELNGGAIYKVSLINLMGMTIYEKINLNSKQLELDLSNEARGIYLFRL